MKKTRKLWKYLVKCGKIEGINLRSDSLKYTFDFKGIGESVDFCTVKAEGFKTACASLSFMIPLSSDASLFALIPNILTRSSKEYPTLTHLEKKLATLYGAEIGVDVSKIGENQVLKLAICSIDDRFALDNENIVSVLDGVVIYVNLDFNNVYTIMVKHSEYLSIYRGVKKSLKSVGDYVPAGECIGIAGESQVGFELWKNDKIINPEEIIAF